MSTKLKPRHDHLLVRRVEVETQKGTIFIPTAAQELPTEGIVLAHGNKVKDLSPGTRVLFGKYSGMTVERDGEKLLLLQDNEILCVVEEEKDEIH